MTKKVRIENANTADWTVTVKVQLRTGDGNWVYAEEPDKELSFPGQAIELDIWDGKRLIIEEGPLTLYSWTDKEYIKRLEDHLKLLKEKVKNES